MSVNVFIHHFASNCNLGPYLSKVRVIAEAVVVQSHDSDQTVQPPHIAFTHSRAAASGEAALTRRIISPIHGAARARVTIIASNSDVFSPSEHAR